MNSAPKDNVQILADPQRFKETYARARAFFSSVEGVSGVGFGLKETGGQLSDDISIIVYVREKRKEEELSPEQRVPPEFEGYRTDVQVVHEAVDLVCDNTAEYERIQGGIQITASADPLTGEPAAGTLGCIVRKRNDSGRENVYLLTCKHVLFPKRENETRPWVGAGGYAYHPWPPAPEHTSFKAKGPSKALGPVQPAAFLGNTSVLAPDHANPGQFIVQEFFIDCAIARLDLDSICCGSTCTQNATKYDEAIIDLQLNGANTITDVRDVFADPSIIFTKDNPRKVVKVGRTTGRTFGKVTAVNTDFNPRGYNFLAKNAIQIDFDTSSTADGLNCRGNASFGEPGDSGSLVLDEQGRAIGLLHGSWPPPFQPRTFACNIQVVLDSLDICIATTTGTSHGSSQATDGSGRAPAAVPPDRSTLPTGQIVFTSPQDEAAPSLAAPRPVTDDEVRNMRELLAAFRETRLGPGLHAVFAEIRREIGYLVRNSRPIKVAWHRHKGPAFFAHVLNHLTGHTDRVPHMVDGVTRRALLVRMREVLTAHGSNPLRRALERYGDDLLAMLTRRDCDSVADCLAYLREKEPA